jgi:transposase-like protein
MAEPELLTCPRCGSSDWRPVSATGYVRTPKVHCNVCGNNWLPESDTARRDRANAKLEKRLTDLETENARLRKGLDKPSA